MEPKVRVLDSCVPEGMEVDDQKKHGAMTVFIEGASRVFTHELVRHRRNMSYSQQSQRYVDERGFEFVIPDDLPEDDLGLFETMMHWSKMAYEVYRKRGIKKQTARYLLPNAVEAPIVVTGTFKAWEHFFTLRMDKAAQPEMRLVASIIAMNAGMVFPLAFEQWFIKAAIIIKEFGWDCEFKIMANTVTD